MGASHPVTGWTPLAGIRVVDASRWVAGPFAARVLGMLGAHVVRFEPIGRDPLLELGASPTDAARCAYDHVNAHKELRTVDDVAAAVMGAVADGGVDVVVMDRTPSEQRRDALEIERLRRTAPGLVVASVTGYGLTGPHAERTWCSLTAYHAGSEAATLPGPQLYRCFPDRPPVRAGRELAEHDAGLTTALGAVAALVRCAATGRGDTVEVSGQEVEIGLNRTTVSRGLNEGRDFDRTYQGYGWQGTLRARDGWVCLRPNEDRHWRAFTQEIGRPELADDPRYSTYEARFEHGDSLQVELESWTRTVDRARIRQAMAAAGVPGAPYLESHEIVTDPTIASREVFEESPDGGSVPRLPLRLVDRAPQATPRTDAAGRGQPLRERLAGDPAGAGPLAGLRVLDMTWVASGPYATLLLRTLGAEVLKVEAPDRPDLFRRSHGSDADPDAGLRFVDLNQGKRSVTLDLKDVDDRAAFDRLVAECDVLVENFRVGVRDRIGIGDAELWAVNPELVTVSLSGFGSTAQDRHRPGYASVFSAEGGISAMTGYPDAAPTDVRDSNDLRGGTATALAAVASVLERLGSGRDAHRTDRAAAIELGMRDVVIWLQGDVHLQASRGGRPTRAGNDLDGCPAHGCWSASDGRHVAVGVRTGAERAALAKVLGLRGADGGELRDALLAWLTVTPAADVVEQLAAAGVPVSLTAQVSDLAADPHLAERGVFRWAHHARLGELRLVNGPIRCQDAGWFVDATPSPLLGEHRNEELGR